MKSMIKLGALVAVSLLLTASAFAGCRTNCRTSCRPKCETRCEAPCKLPSPKCTEVQYSTTCEGTPRYHWVCQKVYEPCEPRETVTKKQVIERCTGVYVEGENGDYAPIKHKAKKHVQ